MCNPAVCFGTSQNYEGGIGIGGNTRGKSRPMSAVGCEGSRTLVSWGVTWAGEWYGKPAGRQYEDWMGSARTVGSSSSQSTLVGTTLVMALPKIRARQSRGLRVTWLTSEQLQHWEGKKSRNCPQTYFVFVSWQDSCSSVRNHLPSSTEGEGRRKPEGRKKAESDHSRSEGFMGARAAWPGFLGDAGHVRL